MKWFILGDVQNYGYWCSKILFYIVLKRLEIYLWKSNWKFGSVTDPIKTLEQYVAWYFLRLN